MVVSFDENYFALIVTYAHANTDYSRPYHTIEKRLFKHWKFFRLFPFLVDVMPPCEQEFLSGMAFSICKDVRVACQSCGWFKQLCRG